MGFTKYTDIYDPITIKKIIGQEWIKLTNIFKSGIVNLDPRPVEGSLTYELRETRFQDSVGQNLKAGGTISSKGHTQVRKQHPVIWKYGSSDEPDVIREIESKDVPRINADLAGDIKKASTQYVDNSVVATIKGVGAALTSNQKDQTGAAVTLVDLIKGFSTQGEKGVNLQGGGLGMRNEPYFKLVELGLVAQTANTFGNELQTFMVQEGKLPSNIVGMTAIISDKFTSLGSNQYYLYFIGKEAIRLKGNDVPDVEVARAAVLKKYSTITNFKVMYGIGIEGANWTVGGKEDVSDVELATSSSWNLAAANDADAKLTRVKIQTA